MFIKNTIKFALICTNIALVFFLILFSNVGLLPLKTSDLIFFSLLMLGIALYRPGWAFLFFVGTIALENINLAPPELGAAVRPYQLLGAVTIIAVLVRLLTKRLNFKLAEFTHFDAAAILLGVGSFLSVIGSPAKGTSLKLAIIMLSYIAFYFLVRNFLQTKEDLKKVIPFFLSSAFIVVSYAIWQNVRFLHGLSNFEVMPGRPNGTFAEADWLGIYLSLLLALIYSLIFYVYKKQHEAMDGGQISNFEFRISNQFSITEFQILKTGLVLFLFMTYVALILTVSRSAWLGAVFVTVAFLLLVFTRMKINYKSWRWRDTVRMKLVIVPVLILSVVAVYFFHLTDFQLGNRAQSTGSGLQEITIACDNGTGDWKSVPADKPLMIENVSELEQYHCRHINLEDIDVETAAGNFVTVALRKDPNISIRSEIYAKSWNLIRNNLWLGIGWGSVSLFLGTDARGAGLNASNIFLEAWLGAGLLGLIAFLVLLFSASKNALDLFLEHDEHSGIFLLLGLTAVVVPNLFNSGILLGFLWLFLGAAFIKNKEKN
jgi:hypothetical protein